MGHGLKNLVKIVVISSLLFSSGCLFCFNKPTTSRIGLLQSELTTLTVECNKCNDGILEYCKNQPCEKIPATKVELEKLLNE